MALSNSLSLYSPSLSSSIQLHKLSRALEFSTLAFQSRRFHFCRPHLLGNSTTRISLSTSSLIRNKSSRPFRAPLSAHASAPQVDVNESEHEEDLKQASSLKFLINVYKEAILEGDEKTISDIEAMIYIIENEKNNLFQKVTGLTSEINSGKEKYIRLQADFDNFRKRSEKERLTVRNDTQGEVIESLLPMVDNFERAKQQLKLETEREKKIDASYQGIYKQFVEIMRSLRVSVIATVGNPFDPLLHEAIAREESQEFKEGIIIQEYRRGFLLGDRLLRPATVKVSAGPGKKKSSAPEQPATTAGVDER